MPDIAEFPASPQEQQLRMTNERIAALAMTTPYSEIHSAFTFAAQLAMEALSAATELGKMPGVEREQLRLTIDFWHSLADHSRTAALACLGGNQNLAEATVAFMFLQTSCARKPVAAEPGRLDGQGKVAGK